MSIPDERHDGAEELNSDGSDHPAVLHTWTAPSLQPITALYVIAVFVVFMAMSYFVFDSVEAVKALSMGALASVAALMPGLLKKFEYQFRETGLVKRPIQPKRPRDFKDVFSWEQLTHVSPTKSGFKYFKRMESPNPLIRALKLHLVEGNAGEFHVRPADRDRVVAIIDQHAIPTSKPSVPRQVGP